MDKVLKQFAGEQNKILRFVENAAKTATTKRSPEFIKARITLLENYWSKYSETYSILHEVANVKELTESYYFKNGVYDDIESAYIDAKVWLEGQLPQLPTLENFGGLLSSTITASENQNQVTVRLPKLNLPSFNGSYLQWPSFRDTFVSLIHDRESLTKSDKLHYLKAAVTGEAAKLISNLSVTNVIYDSAWKTLMERFENKRILVNTNIHSLVSLPPMSSEPSKDLTRIVDTFGQAVSSLENLTRPVSQWDDWLVYFLASKLDPVTRKDWKTSLSSSTDPPKYDELRKFLQQRLQALDALKDIPTSSNRPSRIAVHKPVIRSITRSHHSSPFQCHCCQGKHILMLCPKFKVKSVDDRLKFVHNTKLCTNCFGKNHSATSCPSHNRCKHCSQLHHTMLHRNTQASTSTRASQSIPEVIEPISAPISQSMHSNNLHLPSAILLATAIVNVRSPDGRTIKAALLDQGSESNFITSTLANRLHLPKQKTHISIYGVGQCSAGASKASTTYEIISAIHPSFRLTVESLILTNLTHLLPSTTIRHKDWSHIVDLPLADPEFYKPGPIDLILGATVYAEILLSGVKKEHVGSPLAQETTLGWILSGNVSNTSHSFNISEYNSESVQLGTQSFVMVTGDTFLRKFWELEEIPKRSILKPEDEDCERHFLKNLSRTENGRYVVKLPFYKDPSALGQSRASALISLYRLEKRFNTDQDLKMKYIEFMTEYINLDHMEQVVDENIDAENTYYIPHHAVFKTTKIGGEINKKLRVVFNASKATSSGVSLNDLLHIGPKLQNDIFRIILKWRLFKFVLISDIEKMFRQILVANSDCNYQRILWRNSPVEPVQCYHLKTVTYGTSCAPYLACRVLKQLAHDYKSTHPAASEIITKNFYVDDALFGAHDKHTAIQIRDELVDLLGRGGFKLSKWNSNFDDLLNGIAQVNVDPNEINILKDLETKTLGIGWKSGPEIFYLQVQLSESNVISKRTILSDISRIYDPLGWMSPVTVTAQIFIQKLWLTKLDWDTTLPTNLANEWSKFKSDLVTMNNIGIPRWVGTSGSTIGLELHGFCDASLSAYGAVVYLRVMHSFENFQVSLLAAKSRVSPLKTISLPRLELAGAAILAELVNTVQETLELHNVPVYLWSDSTIVLAWLQEHPSKWNVFVANRVSIVHEKQPSAIWRHVISKENPADCVSRGIPPSTLKTFDLWWSGPSWLSLHSSNWPVEKERAIESMVEAERRVASHHTSIGQEPDCPLMFRFSKLSILIHVTAYCLRFRYNATSALYNSPRLLGPLSLFEIKSAHDRLIVLLQKSHFPSDYDCLSKRKPVPTSSKLRNLNPFIDNDGAIRVGGRLCHSLFSFDEKHPFVLPKQSHLTTLIIRNAHMKTLHGGPQATLHHLRTQYWILGGRSIVRNIVRQCITCRRYNFKSRSQIMGNLPPERVRPSRPFLHSGFDYAGPFFVRPTEGRGKTTIKTYVAIFVCFSTRAVHLELVMSLTTTAFIAAFKRFVSRRGRCAKLFSDNATNFISADKQLKQHISQLLSDDNLKHMFLNDGTEWKFIPPVSPHFGGLWEASVKSFKFHFRRVVGNQTLTIEEMFTLIAQIEACLNSRPLYPISDDPQDHLAITPAHFIIGESILTVPTPSTMDLPKSRLNRWELVQNFLEAIWRSWRKDYIHNLQLRRKWQSTEEQSKINDLVFIADDNLPPAKWLLGRVVNCHPGSDGFVRVVTVKTKYGDFKRPVNKICPLPLNVDE